MTKTVTKLQLTIGIRVRPQQKTDALPCLAARLPGAHLNALYTV